MKKALILVDIQNDFCPGGALAVPDGDKILPAVNSLIVTRHKYDLVVATQDWHPARHESFASQHPGKKPYDTIDLHGLPQVLWPDHCVQGSHGSAFHPELYMKRVDHIVVKGTDPRVDSYSGFLDNGGRNATELHEYLKDYEIKEIHLVGLATDYCVKFTALDGVRLLYQVQLITEGCRGVNLHPEDSTKAIEEMRAAGVRIS